MLPAASHATSVGRSNVRPGFDPAAGGASPQPASAGRADVPSPSDASFRIELDHHVGAFVDGPDVVLRIDADGVGEAKP